MSQFFFKVVILCFLIGYINSSLAQQLNTIVKAGHLIDVASGAVLENKHIIIQGDRIIDIVENIEPGPQDRFIDLSDSWVSPGLMDCHVHLTTNATYRHVDLVERYVRESDAFRVLRGVKYAKELLHGGFTTVKEIGNDGNYVTKELIKAIQSGWVEGPNIKYAGKIIAPYGGQLNGLSPEHEFFWAREFIDADSHDEIRKAIRKNIYHGADNIKLVTDDQAYFYTKKDIEFAVDEAGRYGLKVSVHAVGGKAAQNVIEGGAASIEHGFFLSKDQLELMKKEDVYLVGTDFYFDNWYAYGMDSSAANDLYQATLLRLKVAHEVGTKMAFGTDAIINLPGMNRLETNLQVLKTWKEAQIPDLKVLQCMTINAAELLNIDKERGKIAKSYIADIVAFSDNPLEDIEHISSVHFVMKEGKVYRNE